MSTNMGNLEKLGILVIVILVVVVGVVAITPKSTVDDRLYPEQTAADVTPEGLEPLAADGKREDAWPVEPSAVKPLPGTDPFAAATAPALPTFRTITVQANDTLASIATRELGNAARFKEIQDANPGLVASKLKKGMEIKIPVSPSTGIASATPAPSGGPTSLAPTSPAPAASGRIYVVKSGDTLSSIAAREMGSTKKWTELAKANEDLLHGSTALKIGMKLQIPTADTGSIPTVASRDPAPVSAAGTTTSIPGASAEREYVVKSGDSLWGIAKHEMGSESFLKDLRAANQDVLKGSDSLKVGMKLRIPAKN